MNNYYIKNGFEFIKADNFAIKYWDSGKRDAKYKNYINGGFFGYYDEDGINFTLCAANLCCDMSENLLKKCTKQYISKYLNKDKLHISCKDNVSKQYRDKNVSTLIIPNIGNPYIKDINILPNNIKYAISGVPTVRNGDDVDYYNYVVKQGWDSSCMYATYRNFIGIKNGEIWIISGRTKTKNYIYGMEMWKILKDEHFDDVICLDGGGSYYYKNNNKASTTFGNRSVNNIIIF